MFKSTKNKLASWKDSKVILKEFNASFNRYFEFSKYKSPKILLICEHLHYNTISNKYSDMYIEKTNYYSNQNIEKKALKMINEGLKKIYIFKSAIDYYSNLLRDAKLTAKRLYSDNQKYGYSTKFKKLYVNRMKFLATIQVSSNKVLNELKNAVNMLESAIKDLKKYKNKSAFERTVTALVNVVIAPFKNAAKIIEGIDKKDSKKVLVGGTLLTLTFLGGSIIAEAIDALEGVDIASPDINQTSIESPINISSSEVGIHHVEPHVRVLSDGTITWVDGDGNPNTTLNANQGGGYFRTNPDGNPFNNFGNK